MAIDLDRYKSEDGPNEVEIKIVCTPAAAIEALLPLLHAIDNCGSEGHCLNIIVDGEEVDGTMETFKLPHPQDRFCSDKMDMIHQFDGDGNHVILEIHLDGVKLSLADFRQMKNSE